MHHDRHLHEAFHEGIKCIMQHVTPDGTFQNLCMTPSFLLSRDDVRIQVPHTDYVVTEPIEQMPWSFSLPLTDAGMQLNCWGVESDGQPFPRNATRIITSKNEALLFFHMWVKTFVEIWYKHPYHFLFFSFYLVRCYS